MSGRLIVLEGLDGSGKATQAAALANRLSCEGRRVRKLSFPNYESPASSLVKMYLAGEIGSIGEVNAFAASSFYSLDRYVSYQTDWRLEYESGCLMVADRYTTSNISHQMVKLPREKWESYIEWLTGYEYGLLGLPVPDLVIYLDMHPEASRRLLRERYDGDDARCDLHERDLRYLQSCREAALFAAGRLGWKVLDCSDERRAPLPIEALASAIYALCASLC